MPLLPQLNHASPVPLYQQLAELLSSQIVAGDYESGERLPSEPELARRFGIGRPTVRQATELLVQKHLIQRRRGSGTFVTAPHEAVDLFSLSGTMASFEQSGVKVESKIVKKLQKRLVKECKHNPLVGRSCYTFSRLSRVRRRPILLEEVFLDEEIFPDFERFDLRGASLSKIVVQDYFRVPQSATQTFAVAQLEANRAALLQVEPQHAALVVRRTLHFEGQRDAIYTELYCKTDDFVFSQTLGKNRE